MFIAAQVILEDRRLSNVVLEEIDESNTFEHETSLHITNRWSCRLKWSSFSYECRRCGSLCAGDSAAQLNSMLDFPKVEFVRNRRLSIGERKMLWGKEPE